MDILETLQKLEILLEQYQDSYEPEEKMDLKQTIQAEIKLVRKETSSLPKDLQIQVNATLNDFEEVLSY